MKDKTIPCWPECGVHSPTQKNMCNWRVFLNAYANGEPVVYGQPCKYPGVFRPLVLRQNKEGELV
ncbi:MAG: hypothetical protein NT076_02150 [Candidatus Pacearchaeota archaeon]|nr:hypothetical protein [Candidatus Pacearchaeota archaeon]